CEHQVAARVAADARPEDQHQRRAAEEEPEEQDARRRQLVERRLRDRRPDLHDDHRAEDQDRSGDGRERRPARLCYPVERRRASSTRWNSRSGKSGASVIETPSGRSASLTAEAVSAGTGIAPASPTPLIP